MSWQTLEIWCECFLFTTIVHHKIRAEGERAQNITRALLATSNETRVQYEDAGDQNCLKFNLPVIVVAS